MDYETKADPLEAAFEGTTAEAPVARPHLSGAHIADPAKTAFVDGYLRRGSRSRTEKLFRRRSRRWRLCGAKGN